MVKQDKRNEGDRRQDDRRKHDTDLPPEGVDRRDEDRRRLARRKTPN